MTVLVALLDRDLDRLRRDGEINDGCDEQPGNGEPCGTKA
jgi:hypothetical protein